MTIITYADDLYRWLWDRAGHACPISRDLIHAADTYGTYVQGSGAGRWSYIPAARIGKAHGDCDSVWDTCGSLRRIGPAARIARGILDAAAPGAAATHSERAWEVWALAYAADTAPKPIQVWGGPADLAYAYRHGPRSCMVKWAAMVGQTYGGNPNCRIAVILTPGHNPTPAEREEGWDDNDDDDGDWGSEQSNGGVRARALVWELTNGQTYMDRPYGPEDDIRTLQAHAQAAGWYWRDGRDGGIRTPAGEAAYDESRRWEVAGWEHITADSGMPYADTFTTFCVGDEAGRHTAIRCNCGGHHIHLSSTDPTDHSGWYRTCPGCNRYTAWDDPAADDCPHCETCGACGYVGPIDQPCRQCHCPCGSARQYPGGPCTTCHACTSCGRITRAGQGRDGSLCGNGCRSCPRCASEVRGQLMISADGVAACGSCWHAARCDAGRWHMSDDGPEPCTCRRAAESMWLDGWLSWDQDEIERIRPTNPRLAERMSRYVSGQRTRARDAHEEDEQERRANHYERAGITDGSYGSREYTRADGATYTARDWYAGVWAQRQSERAAAEAQMRWMSRAGLIDRP